MSVGPILILSDEPVIAALVGLLVELEGREPAFPRMHESPADALERLRPVAVALVDCAFASARSDVFFAMAAQKRVNVVVFGPDARAHDIGEIAAQRSIPWLVLPPSGRDVATALAVGADRPQSRRIGERREVEALTICTDGTPVLSDDEGRRWLVYDRRATHDRRAGETDRVFVALDGEQRQLALSQNDAEAPTLPRLVDQLRRATLV